MFVCGGFDLEVAYCTLEDIVSFSSAPMDIEVCYSVYMFFKGTTVIFC